MERIAQTAGVQAVYDWINDVLSVTNPASQQRTISVEQTPQNRYRLVKLNLTSPTSPAEREEAFGEALGHELIHAFETAVIRKALELLGHRTLTPTEAAKITDPNKLAVIAHLLKAAVPRTTPDIVNFADAFAEYVQHRRNLLRVPGYLNLIQNLTLGTSP